MGDLANDAHASAFPPPSVQRSYQGPDAGLDAFISYSHRDALFVHNLKDALEATGHVVWIDADDIPPGAPWRKELGSGIEAAHAFVFVISPDAVASQECARELARAVELGKRRVPVLLAEVGTIPTALAETHYVDARQASVAVIATRVGEAIDTDFEWVREHTEWLARAIRWQTHHQNGYLLRSAELRNAEAWLVRQSEHHKPPPTPLQTEFIVASRDTEKRRLRRSLALALVAVLVSAALATFALLQRSEAIAQRDRAQSRELAAASQAQLDIDPELSVLLAVEAMKVDETPEATDSLRRALVESNVRATVGADASVTDVAYNPAGNRLVVTSADGVVALLDGDSGTDVGRLGRHDKAARDAVFAPDGTAVATWGDGAQVLVWDVESGDRLGTFTGDLGAFSPDGELIVTGGEDLTVRISDVHTGHEVARLDVGQRPTSVEFSPDGSAVLIAEGRIDQLGAPGEVVLWRFASGEQELLGTYSQPVFSASFDTDGHRLLTVAADMTTVWDVASGDLVAQLGMRSHAAFSPDGSRVLAASGTGAAGVWSSEGAPVSVLAASHGGPILDLAWSDDGTLVATAGIDHTARVWDPFTGAVLTVLRGHTDAVNAVAFSPDARTVATAGSDDRVRLWDIDRPVVMRGHDLSITSVDFSPDGQWLVTASEDATARVWNAGTGEEIIDPPGCERGSADFYFSCFTVQSGLAHASMLTSAEFGPDGTIVLTAGRDGTAGVWDAESGEKRARFVGHEGSVWAASFDRDASRVVTAGEDGTARIWDVANGTEGVVLRGHQGAVTDAVFSPNGRLVVTSGADDTVRLWDATSGDALGILAEGAGAVGGLGISPDGAMVVVPADETAKVFDIDTRTQVAELRGHVGLVLSASFNSDGRLIMTGGIDGTARVWHTADGTEARQPLVHDGAITDVAISPNDRWIATSLGDIAGSPVAFSAQVWDCDTCIADDQLVDIANASVTRALTPSERAKYLGDS